MPLFFLHTPITRTKYELYFHFAQIKPLITRQQGDVRSSISTDTGSCRRGILTVGMNLSSVGNTTSARPPIYQHTSQAVEDFMQKLPFPPHALLLRFAAGHHGLKPHKRGQESSPRTLGGRPDHQPLPRPPILRTQLSET